MIGRHALAFPGLITDPGLAYRWNGHGPRTRVLIADDHDLFRQGLRRLISGEEFEVVGEAATGREAASMAAACQPDVVLMDVSMPDMDGLAALTEIKRDHPHIAVVMVSTYENANYMVRALSAGAAGYLLKGISRQQIVEALRRVAKGEPIVDRARLRSVVESLVQHDPSRGLEEARQRLSDREIRVLTLIVQGLNDREIGDILHIPEGTARSRVRDIISKLGVSDRTQAALVGSEAGLG